MVLAASGSPVDLAIRRQRRAPKTTNKHTQKKKANCTKNQSLRQYANIAAVKVIPFRIYMYVFLDRSAFVSLSVKIRISNSKFVYLISG